MDSSQSPSYTLTTSQITHEGLQFCSINLEAPPAPSVRAGVNLICAIDKSGSMSSVSNQVGEECSAFTRLDLAKHSLAVLVHHLLPQDCLTLISFDNGVQFDFKASSMDEKARSDALASIAKLNAGGGTKLFEALGATLTHLAEPGQGHPTILLLTDGEPSDQVGSFFSDQKAAPPHTLHTLGFGYDIKSDLLAELAQAGGGLYAFIPDATIVGTVFVNFVSFLLSIAQHHLVATVTGPEGFRLAPGASHTADGVTTMDIGAVQYGQSRTFSVIAPAGWAGTVSVAPAGCAPIATAPLLLCESAHDDSAADDLARSIIITAIIAATRTLDGYKASISEAAEKVSRLQARHTESKYLQALLEDLTAPGKDVGQLGHAVENPDFFSKWGKHYLPSVARAHQLQSCMNFKDAALQFYGGTVFRSVQASVESLFCSLPAPKPTGSSSGSCGRAGSAGSAGPQAMQSFYNYGGGCFYGPNEVVLQDGRAVAIRDLQRGDRVPGSDGAFHAIACVAVTPIAPGCTVEYCDVGNGVLLTPYHPVRHANGWAFPIDVGARREVATEAMYNFLLEDGVDMVVDGRHCITLAHGIVDSTVATHEYLGTARVANDLKGMRGWAAGRVVLDAAATERNPVTQRITRWVELA
jgi:hypothetical protein